MGVAFSCVIEEVQLFGISGRAKRWRRRFQSEVSEDLGEHRGIAEEGQHGHWAGAARANQDVKSEDSAQKLCPWKGLSPRSLAVSRGKRRAFSPESGACWARSRRHREVWLGRVCCAQGRGRGSRHRSSRRVAGLPCGLLTGLPSMMTVPAPRLPDVSQQTGRRWMAATLRHGRGPRAGCPSR